MENAEVKVDALNDIKDDVLPNARLFAAFEGINLEIKNIVEDWLLITYDLPKEENKARYEFLRMVPKIGAVMHSRSVYLMPVTKEGEMAALELRRHSHGAVYFWNNKVTDPTQREELTMFYDMMINTQLDVIQKRINKIKAHKEAGKLGLAARVMEKTVTLASEAVFIIQSRGSVALSNRLLDLKRQMMELNPVLKYMKESEQVEELPEKVEVEI